MAIDGTLIAGQVVTTAMQTIGVLSAGENATAEEASLGFRELNFMLKSWQARGITSWRDQAGTATLPANTAELQLSPYAIDLTEVRVVQAANYERPLQRWTLGQYRQIPNKATPGYPTAYAVTKTDNTISLLFWPVPTQDADILYSYARVSADVTEAADSIDVPQEWTEAVYVGLAARLCQSFGVTRTDPATAQLTIQRAGMLENELFNADRPASIFMGSAYGRNF